MFALFDAKGGFVNGKHETRVHELRVNYDPHLATATFASARVGASHTFAFDDDPAALEAWLTRHFERSITVRRDAEGGFPDDTAAPGPTIVSTATLALVASWFPGLTPDDMRVRLRANIEVDGVPAFWEDGLYAAAGETLPFRIGSVVLEGTNPCARCVVPSRDPTTGAALSQFARVVAERRAAHFPPWADRTRFDHFYRLAVNMRVNAAQGGRLIRVGDVLERLAVTAR